MEIKETSQGGVTIFDLDGRIDSIGAVDLDLALQTAISEGRYNLVLNLTNVRYINSSGLRTLADILTRCRDNAGDLRLVGLSPKVRRVFEIIGFDNFFSIYDTTDAAVGAFA